MKRALSFIKERVQIVATVGIALLVTAFCAVYLAGYLTPNTFTARDLAIGRAQGVRSDGWLESQALLTFENFSTLGNYLEFRFNPWRPAGVGLADLRLSVCGGAESAVIPSGDTPMRFGIPNSNCNPIMVSIQTTNPFTPLTESGGASLGINLEYVQVSSRLGVPILPVKEISAVFGSLALLALFAAWSVGLKRTLLSATALITTPVFALTFVVMSGAPIEKLIPLFVFVSALLLGVALFAASDFWIASKSSKVKTPGYLWLPPVMLGATLRLYGIDFGLPANFHPDEVPKVNAIMRMYDQHTWNPEYFLHPSLLLYSTYFCNVAVQYLGPLVGFEGTFRETAFLAGRIVSVSAGFTSIAFVYFIASRLFSRFTGLWGATLLAVFPLHVTCSRYLKEDALLTFVVLSCVAVTVVAVQSNRKWLLLVSGLLAGFTAGTKYSGILMVVVPGCAPWLVSKKLLPDRAWLPWAIAAALIAPLGFFITTPYALLNYAKFSKDFASESHHMQVGHTTAIDPWSQLWMYHFWRSLMPGMTEVVAVLSIVGAGFLLRRGKIEDLFLLGLIALFYLPAEYVKAKPAPQPERYVMPCLPFLAIAAAEMIRSLSSKIPLRAVGSVCIAIIVLLPLSRSASLAGDLSSDTRIQMATWMKMNIPPRSKVLMDWKPYCPRFDVKGYEDYPLEVIYIPRARIIPELDLKALKASGADYLILSSLFYGRYFSQPESNPILRQRIREVFERVPVVKQFSPDAGTYGFHNPVLTLFALDEQSFTRLESEIALKRSGGLIETSNDVRAKAKW